MLWRTVFLTRHEKQFQYTLPKSIKWAKICWSIDKQTMVLMAGAGTPRQHRGCPTAPALQRALGEKRRLAECPTHTSGFMGFSFALTFWQRLNMRSISLQNLSDESSYSHIFPNNPNLFNHAEVTLLALTISAAAFSKLGGSCATEARGWPPHNTQIRTLRTPALSYFPYFLTHSSYGLMSCLIFCDCGCTLSRCLHRAVRSDPRVFFPSGYSSFKAQQCVRGARAAPSPVPNLPFGSGDFHLPLWSSFT